MRFTVASSSIVPASNANLVGTRNQDRLGENTAKDTFAQRFNNVTALNDRRHGHTVAGFAVDFRYHEVLCNVDETTRQVT